MSFLKKILLIMGQLLGALVVFWILSNTMWLSRTLYAVCAWGIMPLMGGLSAYIVTYKGVSNYLAWMPPPAAQLAAYYLAFFYLPDSAGPFFVCVMLSIIGAATGDVAKKWKRAKN